MRFGAETSRTSSQENRGAEHMGMPHKTINFIFKNVSESILEKGRHC